MSLLGDFLVEATAGLLGVFAGVVLALWVERRRQWREEERARERDARTLAEVRKTILSNVVKNTSEAKRLAASLGDAQKDPYLFHVSFELAVWDATRPEFVRLASLDERVLFMRFFDHVGRLQGLVEFCRRVRSEVEIRQMGTDAGDAALFARIEERLRETAEDVRLEGFVLVTDHGEPVHRRLLGIRPDPTQES